MKIKAVLLYVCCWLSLGCGEAAPSAPRDSGSGPSAKVAVQATSSAKISPILKKKREKQAVILSGADK